MKELVFVESIKLDEKPYTTSEVIAEYAGIEHRAVNQMVKKYKNRIETMGKLTFEMLPMPSGQKAKVYKLNEVQATFVVTLLKNTQSVVNFKQELSKQFYSMKQELMKRQMYRELEKPVRKSLTDAIKENEHSNKWTYKQITDLICKVITGYSTNQLKEYRQVPKDVTGTDIYSSEEFEKYQALEEKTIFLLEMGMDYQQIKSVLNGASIEVTVPTKVKV